MSDIDDVAFHGYYLNIPESELNFESFTGQQTTFVRATLFSDFNKPIQIKDSLGISHSDNNDFQILRNDTTSLGGCSGSPVFFRLKRSRRWILGGIYSSIIRGTKIAICVKSMIIKNKIEFMLNQ